MHSRRKQTTQLVRHCHQSARCPKHEQWQLRSAPLLHHPPAAGDSLQGLLHSCRPYNLGLTAHQEYCTDGSTVELCAQPAPDNLLMSILLMRSCSTSCSPRCGRGGYTTVYTTRFTNRYLYPWDFKSLVNELSSLTLKLQDYCMHWTSYCV